MLGDRLWIGLTLRQLHRDVAERVDGEAGRPDA